MKALLPRGNGILELGAFGWDQAGNRIPAAPGPRVNVFAPPVVDNGDRLPVNNGIGMNNQNNLPRLGWHANSHQNNP